MSWHIDKPAPPLKWACQAEDGSVVFMVDKRFDGGTEILIAEDGSEWIASPSGAPGMVWPA